MAAWSIMRELIEILDNRFQTNHERAIGLLEKVGDTYLFIKPNGLADSYLPISCGENIVRSAAVVEQAFGGITTRLWDDPFEWTLPEELSSIDRIAEYLNEVAEHRKRGVLFLASDDDLRRVIPAPQELRPILDILVEALSLSSTHLGQTAAILHVLRSQ
jgi:hypothetical protein